MKKSIRILSLIAFVVLLNNTAKSHCEVPCGIYDDEMRIALIKEHITTIAKAMKNINALEAEGDKGMNQLVRWINTKEEHANKIQRIASQYFMTQRIKIQEADDDKNNRNQEMLTILHRILVYAMKCKQTADVEMTTKLLAEVEKFDAMYFKDKKHDHKH